MPRRCDKCFANATAFGCTHGDILQVGFIAGEPPGHRYRLRIIGMHPPGSGIHHAWQLVGIGRLKLGKAAVIEQDFWQRIIQGKPLQHFFVGGRRAARCFFNDRQLELVEQDFLDLLR